MFSEPPNNFLYSAYRINTGFECHNGTTNRDGTGFLVENDEPKIPLIITNRHVVDLEFRTKSQKYLGYLLSSMSITGRRPDDSEYTFNLHFPADILFHSNPENDVAIIIPRMWADDPKETMKGFHYHFGLNHLATGDVYKSIKPFDLICYTGFPDQHDKFGNRPILRSGRIASDPVFDYSWDKKSHGSCVAYEGFSYGGSSGSPVFAPSRGMAEIPNSRHGYLIGVNAGHLSEYKSGGHSGISYFYKSTVILEILDENNYFR
ncbi:MAG: trypsin-like peptidase domain-containing protein [Verrucomicrobiales bacterium]|nr:trypsin-like peptidase domain-containing protein [Verrucomicrobiales bacterium]